MRARTYLRGGSPGLVLRVRPWMSCAPPSRSPGASLCRSASAAPVTASAAARRTMAAWSIDVSALNDIEVLDESRPPVRIGPGARWQEVAAALAPHGWAPSPRATMAGRGGRISRPPGGVGFLACKHGLTIDHPACRRGDARRRLAGAASADEHPDLFWAVRGARRGTSACVHRVRVRGGDEVGPVGWAQLAFARRGRTPPVPRALGLGRRGCATRPHREPDHGRCLAGAAEVCAGDGDGRLDDADVILERLQPYG